MWCPKYFLFLQFESSDNILQYNVKFIIRINCLWNIFLYFEFFFERKVAQKSYKLWLFYE